MCAQQPVRLFPYVFGLLLILVLRERTLKSHFTVIIVVIMLILTVNFV